MSSNTEVICRFCNKSFSAHRYYLCHFRYLSNIRCKNLFYGLSNNSCNLQQKRPHEDTQDLATTIIEPDSLNNPCSSIREGITEDLSSNVNRSSVNVRHDSSNLNEDEDDSDDFCVFHQDDITTNHSFVNDDLDVAACKDIRNTNNFCVNNDGTNTNMQDLSSSDTNVMECDTKILDDFHKYTQQAYKNHCSLTSEDHAGIELLELLAKARAPLNLYDNIYKWHTNNLDAVKVVPHKALLLNMKKRYHLNESAPRLLKSITLPHSRACVDLVVHDFKWQVQSLLTDPRIRQCDYLFHDNDPFAAPPEHLSYISDVNSGLAYRETYKKLITDPTKQVLLPIIFYMDGAVTGQYDKLPIEALKFTLGIFKGVARNRKSAWRELGYVTNFFAEETQGLDQIRKSRHMDTQNYFETESVDLGDDITNEPQHDDMSDDDECIDDDINSDVNEVVSDDEENDDHDDDEVAMDTCSAQDLHAMLAKFLENGFEWDLHYNDSTHRVQFIPFVLFIKGDTVEHDKHCGSYTNRTKYVQQLCCYCCCPNINTDEPYRRDDKKHPKMIQDLVDGLKAISQQYIQNTWYMVRFGLHNNLGIHGACTLEMLHWLQLGKYKYIRKMFFAQSGKTSTLSTKLNTLAKMFGLFYKRNSDRELPRTDFAKGIMKGKLMANEYTGLILILCTVIRCTEGRRLLLKESRGNQRKMLGELPLIKNWIMLLESMLQWEAWLKQSRISVFDIHRFEVKVRELMEFEKVIGARKEGMKFCTFNFHASIHVADDILAFGVPTHVNTSSDESQHKPDKTAAKRTQRRPKTFDKQSAD